MLGSKSRRESDCKPRSLRTGRISGEEIQTTWRVDLEKGREYRGIEKDRLKSITVNDQLNDQHGMINRSNAERRIHSSRWQMSREGETCPPTGRREDLREKYGLKSKWTA
jgi:hypothetical protein